MMAAVLSSKNSIICYLEISDFSSSFASFSSYPSLLAVSNMSTGEGTSMSAKLEVLRALRDVESKVDDKLSAMKREMESANDHLVKKMRLDTKPTFKKRGHEKYQFNEQIRDKINAAAAALEQTPAMKKAHTCLQEGEKLINLRQKNILIAHRSEHGWSTVAENEDELADNFDEKRLFRAEVRAGWKIKQ